MNKITKKSLINDVLDELLAIKWQPDKSTLIAIVSYIMVTGGLLIAFQVFTTARVALNFIMFGPISLVGLGVALPILYTALIDKKPIGNLGITKKNLLVSLLIGLFLGLNTYLNTIAKIHVNLQKELFALVTMALVVGLFENIFFRGWLQTRFENAFGIIPGVVLSALFYSGYHIGYGMDLNEMIFLFSLGLMFSFVFRLTRNVFVLWPFYTPIGGLFNNLSSGLSLPFEASYGFAICLALMAILIFTGKRINLLKTAK